MFQCRREMTLQDALADPLVQAVMAADGVDPQKLERCFGEIAQKLRRRDPQR
jgi:hypothetical protein